MNRPSWDEYFMEITKLTSNRSNCIRKNVGCIIVKDTRILSLGYNGTPRGITNCYEGGCHRCNTVTKSGNSLDLCICLHAEENAILFLGTSKTHNATLYTTLLPCIACTKKIIQSGISRVVYLDSYREELDNISLKLMRNIGISIEQFSDIMLFQYVKSNTK